MLNENKIKLPSNSKLKVLNIVYDDNFLEGITFVK